MHTEFNMETPGERCHKARGLCKTWKNNRVKFNIIPVVFHKILCADINFYIKNYVVKVLQRFERTDGHSAE